MCRRFAVLVLSAVLAVALAACGVPAPAESTAVPGLATSGSALPEDWSGLLGGVLGYEADSAGGSLKAALVAANLTAYFAENETPANLREAAADWLAGLNEEDRALVALNWPGIVGTARALAADAAGQADLLESAGCTIDFTALDTARAAAALDALDAALQAA